ncbi:predicted protein [Nematostella vectensis]|uniref:G-protein coupled receptors family 1 profile domain-containing protein n=1 Tax=Nematostella vectensis TaxID=45351 RepID=A7RHQ2_NEMVE|nr:predicted protein [Nematostella vectensis]|eukprot:XP_001640955.1 predicted protein [Nematostella vectensis]
MITPQNASESQRDFVCDFIGSVKERMNSYPAMLYLSASLNVPTSIMAVVCNSLVLASIWRTPSLHAPSYLIRFNLAITDLAVGLFVQPLYISQRWLNLLDRPREFCVVALAMLVVSVMFAGVSFLTITAICVERYLVLYLHLAYQSVVTNKRTIFAMAGLWITGSLYVGFLALNNILLFKVVGCVIITICLVLNTVSYVKIYKVVRHHQNQISEANRAFAPNSSTVDMRSYRRSVYATFRTYIIFILFVLPFLLSLIALAENSKSRVSRACFHIASTIYFSNSAFNPFIYCWKEPQIKQAIKATLVSIKHTVMPER